MSIARGMLFLALAFVRLSAGVEAQSDGFCKLGDDMCHPSPKALIQKNSRIMRNLAVFDSERSSAVSTANGTVKHLVFKPVLNDDEYQKLAKQCCWDVMKPFVIDVIHDEGFEVCDEGGLMGLLWWYDCHDDHQTYENLVDVIHRHGPGTDGTHKGDCPWLGNPGCVGFPKNRKCEVFSGPGPTCKASTTTTEQVTTTMTTTTTGTVPTTSTLPTTTLPSTTTTTSMCTEENWDDEVFGTCDFWGDPHWKATFFAGRYPNENGRRWDFYGNGIFEVASANDGSFKMQSFQCKVENGKNAVAVAFVFELNGRKYFVHDKEADIDGAPQNDPQIAADMLDTKKGYRLMSDSECVRLELGAKQRKPKNGVKGTPPWAMRLALRVHKDLIENDGLCEVITDKDNHFVSSNEITGKGMFSQSQIDTICPVCKKQPPAVCSSFLLQKNASSRATASQTGLVMQEPDEALEAAKDACKNANPVISFADAEQLCAGAIDIISCITDYCSTDGDKAMVEMAVEEKTRFLVGCKPPGGACISNGDCCDGMYCSNSTCKYRKLATCAQPLEPPPSQANCDYSEEACRWVALASGLKLGSGGHEFAGNYGTKGCYTYQSGNSMGKAFYGWLDGGDVKSKDELGELTQDEQVRVDTCMQEMCVAGRAYATNGSSFNKRCTVPYRMTNPDTNKQFWESNDLDHCANLCDTTRGCVSFDFNWAQQTMDSGLKHRCTLCQEMPEGCPGKSLQSSTTPGRQALYYHMASSGCLGCKNSGDACSVQQDCCNGMICEHSVCKDPKLLACSHAKENADTCVTGHPYATNSSSKGKRCNLKYVIPSTTTDYHEVDRLEECADLCDEKEGCVAFDMKDRQQQGKYRCALCKAIDEGCPTLKSGQYNHYHLTYSGCNGVP